MMNIIKSSVFTILTLSTLISCEQSDVIEDNLNSDLSSRAQIACDHNEDVKNAAMVNIDLNQNLNIIYDIRDNILDKSPRGIRYVDDYYENSKIPKDYTNFNIQTFYDIIDLMPYIYEAYNHMKDNNYSGIIINSTLRDKLINVLNGHKVLTSDVKYTNMINSLINDSYSLTNKNKSEVEAFMQTVN